MGYAHSDITGEITEGVWGLSGLLEMIEPLIIELDFFFLPVKSILLSSVIPLPVSLSFRQNCMVPQLWLEKSLGIS